MQVHTFGSDFSYQAPLLGLLGPLVLAPTGTLPHLREAPVLLEDTIFKHDNQLVVQRLCLGGADSLVLAVPLDERQPALLALLPGISYGI